MRKPLFIALVAVLALAFALPLIAADAPADGLKMEATKNPVIFNHSTHKSAKCVDCHHLVDGKENYKKCSDAGCHSAAAADKKNAGSYYKIVHDKKAKMPTCISCHADAAGADKEKKKALTGCKKSSCHP
ncbi:cytochrome c3 family protein [Desulfovibrio subterraneus]|jgi:hypothetical protein|uniref:Cytochrome c3 n=1 Tax=Desulfovibrio subterraneus TaxID=2718620 RepID=A0A7J0BG18_9BACT|nr:cytochrome c3 family protein [Desulfovibrio subterraneus]WBF66754.1 cytochrome c3 family protein [Desulfovibrio subterraneus]GFM32468.1 cytochrome c3 [Desulfovibrio subterraneus]